MKSDIEIAQAATMLPIQEIAAKAGVLDSELELFGRYKAKVDYMAVLERLKDAPDGKFIDVTAITPTPLGEGKTVTAVGVFEAMCQIGKKAMLALREPSLGPVFGIKGGAAGGGYSQLVPMEDFNLHFTGDIHAVGVANNLLAAMIDARIMHGNELNIDPFSISWRRVVDLNDRVLREIVLGLGGPLNGVPARAASTSPSPARSWPSSVSPPASRTCASASGRITFGYSKDGQAAHGRGPPGRRLHGRPAQGRSQAEPHADARAQPGLRARRAVRQHRPGQLLDRRRPDGDEAGRLRGHRDGFGADIGRRSSWTSSAATAASCPSAMVIACTMRALKMHGGASGRRGAARGRELRRSGAGCENLEKQIENMNLFGVPVVVTINRFPTDNETEARVGPQGAIAPKAGAALDRGFCAKGGEGGEEAAEAVVRQRQPTSSSCTIGLADQAEDRDYCHQGLRGGRGRLSAVAEAEIKRYTEPGFDKLPICMAKTHLSLPHDPTLKGRPRGFPCRFGISGRRRSGFLYPLCGEMRTMPGLPKGRRRWMLTSTSRPARSSACSESRRKAGCPGRAGVRRPAPRRRPHAGLAPASGAGLPPTRRR